MHIECPYFELNDLASAPQRMGFKQNDKWPAVPNFCTDDCACFCCLLTDHGVPCHCLLPVHEAGTCCWSWYLFWLVRQGELPLSSKTSLDVRTLNVRTFFL